jgi:hexosaminidase
MGIKEEFSIVPRPEHIKTGKGEFSLINESRILISSEELIDEAELLRNYFTPATGYELPIVYSEKALPHDIIIKKVEKTESSNKEEYCISVTKKNITISSCFLNGIARGIQTVRQLLPLEIFSPEKKDNIDWIIPVCEIYDYPRFEWRGMHLDVARYFFSVEEVLRFIDQIALHRLNILHLHLTEDQGWRIEIKKYPKLTELGSKRSCTLIGHESNRPRVYDNTPYGGFYTQEDIKLIVDFASKRHIKVIPEIDMPGHMQAAIHAYPELGCNNLDAGVRCHWGISQHILNPFDSTVAFMKDVLSEIIDIFPSDFIHIGGDEALKHEWNESPVIQEKMHQIGAKNEAELQSWFITQMDKFISSKGRKLIGWDEILEGGLADNAVVMSWRGEEGGIQAAKMNHNVVMATKTHAYFDYYQKQPAEDEPLAIGGFISTEKVFSWEPVPEELRETEFAKCILGGQGQLWTEYIGSRDKLDYMAFPRICALSEVMWISSEKKDYDDFTSRMEIHKKRMDMLEINYCK